MYSWTQSSDSQVTVALNAATSTDTDAVVSELNAIIQSAAFATNLRVCRPMSQ